jgi:hypothetical protein
MMSGEENGMDGCIMRIELFICDNMGLCLPLESNVTRCDGDDICSCGSPLPPLMRC